jgi:hypothetical protein
MKYLGKRGEFLFYEQKGEFPLANSLPVIEKDHIVAGGSALWLLDNQKKFNDIDVWTSGSIPIEAKQESKYAYNYRKQDRYSYMCNVQYIKVTASTPTALLSTFDFDICKVAAYGITSTGYYLCLHESLKPLVDFKHVGVSGCNPSSFNEGTIIRMYKYAKKFKRGILTLFTLEDLHKAIAYAGFQDTPQEELAKAIQEYFDNNPNEYQYELLEHLQILFNPQPIEDTRVGIHDLFSL